MNLNLCAVFFLDASPSSFHFFSWGPNSFSWASTGSGCWKRKRSKKNNAKIIFQNISNLINLSMEICHSLTTYKMTTVCKLLNFNTNTWKLNESSNQSLNHQNLDIKKGTMKYDGGKMRVGRQKGLICGKWSSRIQYTWSWNWMDLAQTDRFFLFPSLARYPWQLSFRLLGSNQMDQLNFGHN